MPTIILLRHGETHWNRAKRVQGHGDSPLTLKGIEQARRYGARIRELVAGEPGWQVVASPLPRCRQTAAIVSEVAGLDFHAVQFDERLREVHTGSFSGLLKADVEARHPELMTGTGLDSWVFRCPGGETHADVSDRIASWLSDRRPGERIVAVSHGIAGKVLRGLYLGADPAEAVTADAPQDALFVLKGGRVERIACG